MTKQKDIQTTPQLNQEGYTSTRQLGIPVQGKSQVQKSQLEEKEILPDQSSASKLSRNKKIAIFLMFCGVLALILYIFVFFNTSQKFFGKIEENHFQNNVHLVQLQKNLKTNLNQISKVTQQLQRVYVKSIQNQFQQCPTGVKAPFLVYYDQNDEQMKNLSHYYKFSSEKCFIPILNSKNLNYLVDKWNTKYINNTIFLSDKNLQEKKMLLIFLNLYFNAGTYIDVSMIFKKISNRCWTQTLLWVEPLFVSSLSVLDNGIILPNFEKFIRIRFPYSSMIRNMIEKINNKEPFDEQCRNRQCLIVNCDTQSIPKLQQLTFKQKSSNQTQVKQNSKITQKLKKQNLKVQDIQNLYFPTQQVDYSIFTGLNSRQAISLLGGNAVIYEWLNASYQLFKFIHLRENQFKIVNKQNKVMKVLEQSTSNQAKIIFQKQSHTADEVWELVPAKEFQIKHAFYIKSFCGKSLKISNNKRYNNGILIQTEFKKQYSQVWIVQSIYNKNLEVQNQKYEEKLVSLIEGVKWKKETFYNEQLQVNFFKRGISQKYGRLPQWVVKPKITTPSAILPQPSNNLKNTNLMFSSSLYFRCAKNYTVAYIWFGGKQMPPQYKNILQTCGNNTRLLTQIDFVKYSQMWNNYVIAEPTLKIIDKYLPIRFKINLLKLLYLYFEGGIYSDFDTQINEECFENIYTEEIIFTNNNPNYYPNYPQRYLPEENFMMVNKKYNQQVRRMIGQLINKQDQGETRWKQCQARQCLIVNCQVHFYDNTYKKGYD